MDMKFAELSLKDKNKILELAREVNTEVPMNELLNRLEEMFDYSNYYCFGLFLESRLIAISSGWLTTRFYSGKQLEIDNIIVSVAHRSKGYGEKFLAYIEAWAVQKGCLSVELNTYVQNAKSHKFYFNQRYSILGYHFQKKVIDKTMDINEKGQYNKFSL
jgi:GNAT superfamily N-acetyltransferase